MKLPTNYKKREMAQLSDSTVNRAKRISLTLVPGIASPDFNGPWIPLVPSFTGTMIH